MTSGSSTPALALDVRKRLGGLDLDAGFDADRDVLVLFGPSGSGKTTLLNMIAGLVQPDHGEIVLDGQVAFRRADTGRSVDVPARHRGIGFVMQQYALFPHMTALENVAYPLGRAPDRLTRAARLLELLGMQSHAGHRPAQLSGGQQQRVALARALAAERRILLLDEPFAALDAPLRERLQADLRRLRQELDLTIILVTHHLEDAFAIGDRLAVLSEGRIAQVGPVGDVFRRPATRGVAEIMGIRNLLSARVVAVGQAGLVLDWDGLQLRLPPDSNLSEGDDVTVYIRPDDVKIVYPDRPSSEAVAHNVFDARVTAHLESAASRVLRVELGNGQEVEVRFPALSYRPIPLEPGAVVRVALRREGLAVLQSVHRA
ncbi:MAG TPA: ABC transporter ATP-binding protein [Longimicrobiales bacterium]|nr:ABC transporter ATP-binding protein [Longimicrobiales bacterium]